MTNVSTTSTKGPSNMSHRRTSPRIRKNKPAAPSAGQPLRVSPAAATGPLGSPVTDPNLIAALAVADAAIEHYRPSFSDVIARGFSDGATPASHVVAIVDGDSLIAPPTARGKVFFGIAKRTQFSDQSCPIGVGIRAVIAAPPPCGHWFVLCCTDTLARYRCTVCDLGMPDTAAAGRS